MRGNPSTLLLVRSNYGQAWSPAEGQLQIPPVTVPSILGVPGCSVGTPVTDNSEGERESRGERQTGLFTLEIFPEMI